MDKYLINHKRPSCSISLRFGTEFDHVTADVLQVFKVKWSKSQRGTTLSQVRMGWPSSNLVR